MVIVHMYEGHVIVRVCACINNCFSEYTCRCITISVLKKLPFSSYSHLRLESGVA